MKKNHYLLFASLISAMSLLSACSSGTSTNPPTPQTPTALMNFKLQSHSFYDLFVVDTADASGSNPDKILTNTRKNFQEIIVDTNLTYQGKTHVARIVYFDTTLSPRNDTNYFYQDPNGDLYRYNFGFSILNQFTYLTQAIGSQVDVGWVLAAKMTSSTGTTWVAKNDSVTVQIGSGILVFLHSQGIMMADTTFLVGNDTIKARHARNIVTATTPAGIGQSGQVIVDSYLSTDIGEVIEDLFRHVSLNGPLITAQAQGKLKIMTQK